MLITLLAMNKNETNYAEYLNYIKRNEATRTPLTLAEFVEAYGDATAAPAALVGVADPIHY